MYFDLRLWSLTAGFRGRMALGAFLGLLALGAGIVRFAFLGIALAAVFDGQGPPAALPWLAAAALAVLARALLDQRRANIAHDVAAAVQSRLRVLLFDKIAGLGPPGSPSSARAA